MPIFKIRIISTFSSKNFELSMTIQGVAGEGLIPIVWSDPKNLLVWSIR